jgi:predicted HAD superfamily hydrolase
MSDNWNRLQQLRDELHLQVHLFEKEAAIVWDKIVARIALLEKELLDESRKVGNAEKHFFVGSDEEIKQLTEDLLKLKKSSEDSK